MHWPKLKPTVAPTVSMAPRPGWVWKWATCPETIDIERDCWMIPKPLGLDGFGATSCQTNPCPMYTVYLSGLLEGPVIHKIPKSWLTLTWGWIKTYYTMGGWTFIYHHLPLYAAQLFACFRANQPSDFHVFIYVCRLQSIRVFCLFSVFNPDELSFLSVQLLCLRGSKLSKPIAITAIYDAMFPGSIDLWWPDGKLHVPHPCGPQQYRSHGLCHGLVSWQPHPERSRK